MGEDVRDEILRQSAELRVQVLQTCDESARIVAKSKKLAAENTHLRHAADDPCAAGEI